MWFTRQASGIRAWFVVRNGNGSPRTGLASGAFTFTVVEPADGANTTAVVAESTQRGGLYFADIPSAFLVTNGLGVYAVSVEVTSSPFDFASEPLFVSARLWDDLTQPSDLANLDVAVSTRAAPGDAMALTAGGVDSILDEAISGHTTAGTLGGANLLALYNDGEGPAVFFDSNAANTNTVLGVDGTFDNPVSSDAAAKTIAQALGVHRIRVRGIMTLSTSFDFDTAAWLFVGDGFETGSGVTVNGQSIAFASFRDLNLRGPTPSGVLIAAERCFITASPTAIEVAGTFANCVMWGELNVGDGAGGSFTRFVDCSTWTTEADGTTVLDFTIAGTHFEAVGLVGAWTLRNCTGAATSAELSSSEGAQAVIANSCTAGSIVLAGAVELIDNSTGTAVDTSRLNATQTDGVLSSAHGAGSWEGAGLTAAQAIQLQEAWTALGLNTAAPATFDFPSLLVQALANVTPIDIVISVVGTAVTLTRQP